MNEASPTTQPQAIESTDSKMKLTFDIKNLPSEVTTLICSFGYPEYKEYMKEICYQINNYTGSGLLEYNMNLLNKDYNYLLRIRYVQCMHDFLASAVDEDVIQDMFKQCTKCCCCSKHGHNRPISYYTDEVSIGENFTYEDECKCICRHMARHIKRFTLEPYNFKYKKMNKCRRKTTFNIQFISSISIKHQSTRILHRHAQFGRVNQPTLP
jgi:hypothetical protein